MNHKEFAILAIIIALTVVAWIVFGIYHANSTSTISQENLQNVIPLTPTFNRDLIDSLSKREE